MVTSLAAFHHGFGPGGRFGYGGGHGFGGGFGWLFLLIPLFWIGVIVLVGALFGRRWRRRAAERGWSGPGWGGPGWGRGGAGFAASSTASAEQVLNDRFARGDIDEVEYRSRLEVLRAGHVGPAGPGKSSGPAV